MRKIVLPPMLVVTVQLFEVVLEATDQVLTESCALFTYGSDLLIEGRKVELLLAHRGLSPPTLPLLYR